MTEPVFRETAAEPRTQSVPLAHLSVELGHLYMEDFEAGPERLRAHFAEVGPWVEAARTAATARAGGKRARISTCFLIDDYFTRFSTPAEVVPMLLAEAERAGLSVDYLARELGCAVTGKVPVAEAVAARIVESPPPGSYGLRPPAAQTGWLANGERSPVARAPQAMKRAGLAAPARDRGPPPLRLPRRRAVERRRRRAAPVVLPLPRRRVAARPPRTPAQRGRGRPRPQPHTATGFPDKWDELPTLLKLNERADPFAAYRTCSVLPTRFLPVEHAVRVILDQIEVDPGALAQVADRSGKERMAVPDSVADRISYVYYAGP